jgi:hypothetical protein
MDGSDSEFLTREKIISRDKLAKYKGSAKVLLAHLDFPSD